MIPRALHRIWLGSDPMPAQFESYGQSWRDHHPGWEVRLWTDGDLEALVDREVLTRCRNAAERADVVRYQILARLGGIYVDTDVECLRSIEPLRRGAALLAGYETKNKVGSAVLGSVPGHPAMLRAAEEVTRRVGRAPQMEATGPHFLTALLRDFPDVSVLPREVFYPYRWYEAERGAPPPGSYAIHHVAGSWGPPAGKESRQLAAREKLEERRQQAEHRAERAERRERRAQRKLAKAERRADAALDRARRAERAWIPVRVSRLAGSAAGWLRRPR